MWLYPHESWSNESHVLGPQHDVLREVIGEELELLASS